MLEAFARWILAEELDKKDDQIFQLKKKVEKLEISEHAVRSSLYRAQYEINDLKSQHYKSPLTLHANQMVRLLARLDSKDEDIQNEVLRAYRETIRSELEKQLAAKPQTD